MSGKKTEVKSTRKRFSAEFKHQALLRATKDGMASAARDLGLVPAQLYACDVPPILSSTAVWSPIPQTTEIGREEAIFRRANHWVPA